MYRPKEHLNEEDQFSVSPCFGNSKKSKEISPTWNLKIFDIEKKSLALNEATKIFGSVVVMINSLGKPSGQIPFHLQSQSNLLPNGPDPPKPLGKDEFKGLEKNKETETKNIKKDRKIKSEALSERALLRDIGKSKKFKEKYFFRIKKRNPKLYERLINPKSEAEKKNKKIFESQGKNNTNSDIAELLNGDFRDLYRRVNKKYEETKKLGETTSLLSLQTRQKIESLESKVVGMKMDLMSPGYKSTQILKESLIKPMRESIFPKIYK